MEKAVVSRAGALPFPPRGTGSGRGVVHGDRAKGTQRVFGPGRAGPPLSPCRGYGKSAQGPVSLRGSLVSQPQELQT
jgi:hypothetical protein